MGPGRRPKPGGREQQRAQSSREESREGNSRASTRALSSTQSQSPDQRPSWTRGGLYRNSESEAANELRYRIAQGGARQTASAGPSDEPPQPHSPQPGPRGQGGARTQGMRSLGGARPLLSRGQRAVQRSRHLEAQIDPSKPVQVWEVNDNGEVIELDAPPPTANDAVSAIRAAMDAVRKSEPQSRQSSPPAARGRARRGGEASAPAPSAGLAQVIGPPDNARVFASNRPLAQNSLPTQSDIADQSRPPGNLPSARSAPAPAISDDQDQARMDALVSLQAQARQCSIDGDNEFARLDSRPDRNTPQGSRFAEIANFHQLIRTMSISAETISGFPEIVDSPENLRLMTTLKDSMPRLLGKCATELAVRQGYVVTISNMMEAVRENLDLIDRWYKEVGPDRCASNLPDSFRALRRKINVKMPILRLEMGICAQDVELLMKCMKILHGWHDTTGQRLIRLLKPWLENALRGRQTLKVIDELLNRYDELGRTTGGDSWLTPDLGLGPTAEDEMRQGGLTRKLSGVIDTLDELSLNPHRPPPRTARRPS